MGSRRDGGRRLPDLRPGDARFTVPAAHIQVLALDAGPASVGGYLQWLLGVTGRPGARGLPSEAVGPGVRAGGAAAAHDLARVERARAEYDVLVTELTAATGLGGRSRLLADEAERDRKTVTARIRYAVRRIAATHPQLGAHLGSAVHTGAQCSYRPEEPLIWRT